MGCGASSESYSPQLNNQMAEQVKSTCLVFGMPDSGQDIFIKCIESCFRSIGSYNISPFVFVKVDTGREARAQWIDEFKKHQKIVISFFFLNVASKANALASLKTLNWFRAQMEGLPQIIPVATVQTEEELGVFTYLKDRVDDTIDISTFNEDNPMDIRQYSEHIAATVATRHHNPM